VVRGKVGHAAFRAELLKRLPFVPEVMICPARELIDLVRADPFAVHSEFKAAKRYLTVLAKRPAKAPRLPFTKPEGNKWQVILTAVNGRFVLSLHRRQPGTLIYPNEVVEKLFHADATTRNWNTIAAICGILNNES